MALELGEHGIAVNSVAPVEIATRMTARRTRTRAARTGPIPAGRPGDAREVGALIAFIAWLEAGYVTGQSYVIDGGLLLMAAMVNQVG